MPPLKAVWNAWTNPELFAQWWGPKGATIEIVQFELKPGGICLYKMAMGNNVMLAKFVYREIVPMSKIVFVNAFSDAEGGLTKNPWLPVWPLEILNNLTLTETNGKTTVTITGGPINASAEEMANYEQQKSGMEQGFAGTWEKLDTILPSING